ncbi:MAG: AAA family ATPase [Draconibacterium sp.]
MENFIDHISISNFKSIKKLKLYGLSRINLFIGKPNVGKSNILEALGLFSLPYLELNKNKKLSSLIQIEHQNELFFDGNSNIKIEVTTNIGNCTIKKNPEFTDPVSGAVEKLEIDFLEVVINNLESDSHLFFDFDLGLNLKGITPFRKLPREKQSNKWVNLKYYNFTKNIKLQNLHLAYLVPPNGTNLIQVIENNTTIKEEIKNLFKEYNLELVFDRASQELKITKPPQNGEIFLIPYSSIAETLQRIIFHKTAIASNKNSVLVFEEPEAHAFPAYISHITHEIIDSTSNQFILSTHSPYVLNDFLENAIDELSIFMVDYKNGETIVNKLTKEDLDDIYGYGIDLFTNYETFLK